MFSVFANVVTLSMLSTVNTLLSAVGLSRFHRCGAYSNSGAYSGAVFLSNKCNTLRETPHRENEVRDILDMHNNLLCMIQEKE